jgi:hypothetical protein
VPAEAARLERGRRAILDLGIRRLALLEERVAEVDAGRRRVGPEPDRLAEGGFRFRRTPELGERGAQRRVGGAPCGVSRQRRAREGLGLRMPADLQRGRGALEQVDQLVHGRSLLGSVHRSTLGRPRG